MKKISKLLSPLMATTILAGSAAGLTSCKKNNADEKLIKQLVETSVEEFKALAVHPRPSYHMTEIRSYIYAWARAHDYYPIVDEVGNIWFDVPATSGCEKYPKVILQGHMDLEFGYDKEQVKSGKYPQPDPVTYKIIVEDTTKDGRRILHAKDDFTNIGADDGVAIAMAFALITNSKVKHGPLRLLFTVDEEVGLLGAKGLSQAALDSDYLLSLDGEGSAEHEDMISSGCQGFCEYGLSNSYQQVTATAENINYVGITVSGLKGYHFMNEPEILYDKTKGPQLYANADDLILQTLKAVGGTHQFASFEHKGDQGKDTVWKGKHLPTFAQAKLASSKTATQINTQINTLLTTWKQKYPLEDWTKVKVEATDLGTITANFMTVSDTAYLINTFTNQMKYEVTDWEGKDDEEKAKINFPDTSFNFSTFTIKENDSTYAFSVNTRGCAATQKILEKQMANSKKLWIDKYQDEKLVQIGQEFSPWDSSNGHQFIDYSVEAYKSFNVTPYVDKIRGGLEPAYFCVSRPTIQPTVIGPRIDNIHTAGETLYVDSMEHTMKAVVYMLKNMNKFIK